LSKEKFEELEQDKRIWWGKDGNNVPALKRFLSDVQQGVVPQTLWKYDEVGHTQDAKKEIHDILQFEKSEDVFSTPKPVALMERIMRIATNPATSCWISSPAVGHHGAGGAEPEQGRWWQSRFILGLQHRSHADAPDKNLCRDVCAERVRRVITGYTNKKGSPSPGSAAASPICAAGAFRRRRCFAASSTRRCGRRCN
jgi:adenine-specific DNA-methyltransferase